MKNSQKIFSLRNLQKKSPKSASREFMCSQGPKISIRAISKNESIVLVEKSMKNGFLKIAWAENFLRIFLGFSRGLLIKARRLSYHLSNSVV